MPDEPSGPPAIQYAAAPCPRCGACNVYEAAAACRPQRDQYGEGTCPSDREDEAGNLLHPTPESLAAYDAWIDRYAR